MLVSYEPTSIATCQDVPSDSYYARHIIPLGSCRLQAAPVERQAQRWFDPEPGDLEQCPQGLVVPRVINKLNDLSGYDAQTHLWPERASGSGQPPNTRIGIYSNDYTAFSFSTSNPAEPYAFYASALPSETTTGVLRFHAMRQHSTARCENVPQSSFPSTCPGGSPFTATFLHHQMAVKVCVPGNSSQVPWTRSRDRQDIDEELWIDVQVNPTGYVSINNFTTHCTSTSTRGYFELGNQYNGNVPGPLLEKWPSQEELVADFNDVGGFEVRHEQIPSEM